MPIPSETQPGRKPTPREAVTVASRQHKTLLLFLGVTAVFWAGWIALTGTLAVGPIGGYAIGAAVVFALSGKVR